MKNKKILFAAIPIIGFGVVLMAINSPKLVVDFRLYSPAFPIPKYYVADIYNRTSFKISGKLCLYDPHGELKFSEDVTVDSNSFIKRLWWDGFDLKRGDKLVFKAKKPFFIRDSEGVVFGDSSPF